MSRPNDQQLENIYDRLYDVVEIECSNCHYKDQVEKSESREDCETLHDRGWRATHSKAYCGKCLENNPDLI